MTTILHVEDNPEVADLVQLAFTAFGFSGNSLVVPTVEAAREILAGESPDPRVDLVISDMNLPDGSGLDVVCLVRQDTRHAHIPVLILSAVDDRSTIDRAYALGANSYVVKSGRGRAFKDVVRALHDHWLRDALLPRQRGLSRTHRVISTGISLRTRAAELYMRLAEQLGDASDAAFWMTLALRQGNLANLFCFLRGQLGERALPDALLDTIAGHAGRLDRILRGLEEDLEAGRVRSTHDALRHVIELVSNFSARPLITSARYLFPVAQVATQALIDLVVIGIDDAVAWLESQATDGSLQDQIATLRTEAAALRAYRAADALLDEPRGSGW